MGARDGVIATKPGWLHKLEVVEVTFDPQVVSFQALVEHAKRAKCAAQVFTRTDAHQAIAAKALGDSAKRSDDVVRIDDDKYYLSRTAYRHVPMTALQAARVNVAIGRKQDPTPLLSPRQVAMAKLAAKHPKDWPVAIGVPLAKAWAAAQARIARLPAPK